MSNIAKHSDSHTRRLCEEKETLGVILHYLQTKDTMLRRQVLLCLSYIAQNSSDKAAQIINSLNNQLLEENIAGATKANIYSIRSAIQVRFEELIQFVNKIAYRYYITSLNMAVVILIK